MTLLRLVVERHAALDRRCQPGIVQGLAGRQRIELFHHVQQIAPIAVGHGTQGSTRLGIQRQWAALGCLGPGDQLFHGSIVEAVENEDLAAGEQRAIQFEGGIFGRRPHKDDRAVLDIG